MVVMFSCNHTKYGGHVIGIVPLWATWAYEYMAIFSILIGITHGGILRELEVCDFNQTWSACQ